jgi:hypothetical protein
MFWDGLFGCVRTSGHSTHEKERYSNEHEKRQQALEKSRYEKFEHGLVSLCLVERGLRWCRDGNPEAPDPNL